MLSIFRIPDQKRRRRTAILLGICVVIHLLPVILFYVVLGSSYKYRTTNTALHDFPGTTWECTDPFIHLQVENDLQVVGYIVIDGEEILVKCITEWGGIFYLFRCDNDASPPSPDTVILSGTCKCTEEDVVVTVSEDYIFESAYRTFTLFRIGELENHAAP